MVLETAVQMMRTRMTMMKMMMTMMRQMMMQLLKKRSYLNYQSFLVSACRFKSVHSRELWTELYLYVLKWRCETSHWITITDYQPVIKLTAGSHGMRCIGGGWSLHLWYILSVGTIQMTVWRLLTAMSWDCCLSTRGAHTACSMAWPLMLPPVTRNAAC